MLKLLIVDDMPIIADGLCELFREEQRMPFEVHKAYSGPDAFAIMRDHTIDIIVSDIKMPELSGLELLREVKRMQPRCKVIFLTSYHDFDYAREAVILGGSDFILKTEGDDRILDAVYKLAGEVMEERNVHKMLANAHAQFRSALPSLQREFLLSLLHGKPVQETDRRAQFHALEIDLDPTLPVHLITVRIDKWKQSMNWSDRALLLYSVRNIMNEYLLPKVRLVTINLDSSNIVGLWQRRESQELLWETGKAFRFVYGTSETIQNTCRDLLKLKLSIVLGSAPADWEQAGEKLLRIEGLMQSGIGLNHELLTTDGELLENQHYASHPANDPIDPGIQMRLAQYTALPGLLASGKQEEFFKLYEELVATVKDAGNHFGLQLETMHYLSHLFIGFINRRQLLSALAEELDIEPLLHVNPTVDWIGYSDFYRALAEQLFAHATFDQKHHTERLVHDVEQYIIRNLNQDLSLTRLGGHVHLNPTYLSRLYKQITGKGISDYIMEARVEKAKYLVAHSDLKIHEIAAEVGYQSGIAFSRFFKKIMNIAPQDYRDMLQEH